jgi:hypothetical protein
MKVNELKKIIKESVREVFQDELKVIVLEAIKGNSTFINEQINTEKLSLKENINPNIEMKNILRQKYLENLSPNSSTAGFNSNDINSFTPPSHIDTINGSLPEGEVNLNQIMGLLNKK